MFVECKLIGGPFDGHILIEDTEKKRFKVFIMPEKKKTDEPPFYSTFVMCEYYRDSINDTRYFHKSVKR